MPKRCPECGGSDLTRVPLTDHRLTNIEVDNVVVQSGLETVRCGECGAESLRIPAGSAMLRTIALALVRMPGRPSGSEIRYLRKSLALSGKDFARVMGVSPETVSRWENDKDRISTTADRLLRLLVKTYDPEREIDYSRPVDPEDDPDKGERPKEIVITRGRGGWREASP